MLRLICILFFIPKLIFSQCPIGSVTLNSQAEVNNFRVDYPNCTELQSQLRVEGADITNLQGLSNLTHLNQGLFLLNNPILPNLMGLQNVEYANGIILIDNASLSTLQGLNNLEMVDGGMQIESNHALENFSGLEKLDSITGRLFIYFNTLLNDISAIENLEYIGPSLVIANSFSLSECSINSICNYINNTTGFIGILSNATGCNTAQEVADHCTHCEEVNHWIGPPGGHWHQANHWSLNEIPTACQHVIISSNSDVKIETGMSAVAYTIEVASSALFETLGASTLNIYSEN